MTPIESLPAKLTKIAASMDRMGKLGIPVKAECVQRWADAIMEAFATPAVGGGLAPPALVFHTIDHDCHFADGVELVGDTANFYSEAQMQSVLATAGQPGSAGEGMAPHSWLIEFTDGSVGWALDAEEADNAIAEAREGATKRRLYLANPVRAEQPEGKWKLVPVEPTEAMLASAIEVKRPIVQTGPNMHIGTIWSAEIYAAMLAAAPSAPVVDDAMRIKAAQAVRDCLDRDQADDDNRPLELWIADSVFEVGRPNADAELWLWRDGEGRYLAFAHEFPSYPGGDPMTLGEPVGRARFVVSLP